MPPVPPTPVAKKPRSTKARTGDMKVRREDLQPGDEMVAGADRHGMRQDMANVSDVISIDVARDQITLRVLGRRNTVVLSQMYTHFWIRARKGLSGVAGTAHPIGRRTPGTTAVDTRHITSSYTPKVIDEYPHQCTRCGGKAYLGFQGVAHKDEKAASAAKCPAPRM